MRLVRPDQPEHVIDLLEVWCVEVIQPQYLNYLTIAHAVGEGRRAYALELAVSSYQTFGMATTDEVEARAREFEEYLKGEASPDGS